MEKRPTKEQLATFKRNANDQSFSAEVRAKFQAVVDKFENVGEEVVDAVEGKKERKPRTPKATTERKPRATKQTGDDIEKAKAEIKARTGKTEEECEKIVEEYRALRTKSQERKKKEAEASKTNVARINKLKKDDKVIEGTNEKTADAVIETTTKDVAEKIEKQIEAVEEKAETEAKKEVEKQMPKVSATEKKKAVKEKVEEKVKEKTKTIVKRVVIDTSALLSSIAESLGKFDKDSQKEFLIKLRSDIDKLISKYSFGGLTDGGVQVMNIQQSNLSSSSVNPTMFGGGGGVEGMGVDFEKVKKADEIYREHNRERISKGIENFSEESVELWNKKYDDRLNKLNLTYEEKSQLNPKNWYANGGGVSSDQRRKGYVHGYKFDNPNDRETFTNYLEREDIDYYTRNGVVATKMAISNKELRKIGISQEFSEFGNGGGVDGKMNFYVAEGTIYWSDESGEYQRFFTRNHIKAESKEKAKMIFIRYIENQTRTNEWDWAEDDIYIEPATDSDEVIEFRGYLSEKDYGGLSKNKFSIDRFVKGGGVEGKKSRILEDFFIGKHPYDEFIIEQFRKDGTRMEFSQYNIGRTAQSERKLPYRLMIGLDLERKLINDTLEKNAEFEVTSNKNGVKVLKIKYPSGVYRTAKLVEGERYDFDKGVKVKYKNGGGIKDVIVYDNNGETFDRYTIFTPDGSVYGMSDNALMPNGFNQYLGDDTEVKKGSHLGKKLKSIPESIKVAVERRMSEYKRGGLLGESAKLEYIDEAFASYELQEKLREKLGLDSDANSVGDNVVISFAYTDYGGDFLDKVAIEYFKENYPENTLFEYAGYGGENAFVFGEPAQEWINSTEDYPLGFEGIEEFYYQMQNDAEYEGFEYFVDDLARDYTFDKEEVMSWLMENKGGYYSVNTSGVDFSYGDLTDELLQEGLIKKEEMKRGGNVNTGRSWKLDRARHNKRENYEVPVSSRKKAHGGTIEERMRMRRGM
jgi:hypothetical protein